MRRKVERGPDRSNTERARANDRHSEMSQRGLQPGSSVPGNEVAPRQRRAGQCYCLESKSRTRKKADPPRDTRLTAKTLSIFLSLLHYLQFTTLQNGGGLFDIWMSDAIDLYIKTRTILLSCPECQCYPIKCQPHFKIPCPLNAKQTRAIQAWLIETK